MPESAVLNQQANRFEIASDKGLAQLVFRRGPSLLDLAHTEVPPEMEGGGYGSTLVKAALEYAKSEKLKVVPSCPFVSRWLERHHEYDDIVVR